MHVSRVRSSAERRQVGLEPLTHGYSRRITLADVPTAAGGHPQIGSTHKNGDRMFGIAGPFARALAERGTPRVSSLHHSTVTEQVRAVRVGDELRVAWDGSHWWASSPAGTVGRLTWPKGFRPETAYAPAERSPYDFDSGTLHVQSVTLNTLGVVIDCGGYVVPDGHTSTPDVATPKPRPRSFLSRLFSRNS